MSIKIDTLDGLITVLDNKPFPFTFEKDKNYLVVCFNDESLNKIYEMIEIKRNEDCKVIGIVMENKEKVLQLINSQNLESDAIYWMKKPKINEIKQKFKIIDLP